MLILRHGNACGIWKYKLCWYWHLHVAVFWSRKLSHHTIIHVIVSFCLGIKLSSPLMAILPDSASVQMFQVNPPHCLWLILCVLSFANSYNQQCLLSSHSLLRMYIFCSAFSNCFLYLILSLCSSALLWNLLMIQGTFIPLLTALRDRCCCRLFNLSESN